MTRPTRTVLTGLISINGEPARLCNRFCDKPDGVLCGRPFNHPDDRYGHICESCVDGLYRSQQAAANPEEQQ